MAGLRTDVQEILMSSFPSISPSHLLRIYAVIAYLLTFQPL